MVITKLRQIVKIRKELRNLLLKFRPWLTPIPVNQSRSIAKDISVSVFLFRLVVHEDIRYFSFKNRKGYFLSQTMKEKMKDRAAKVLNKPKHLPQPKMLWFFSD